MKQTRKCGTIMKQPEFRVIVAGSRGITDYAFIRDRLDRILSGKALTHAITIISGCARGVDTLGERYAHERGYAILQFPADWDRYGRLPQESGNGAPRSRSCSILGWFFPRHRPHDRDSA